MNSRPTHSYAPADVVQTEYFEDGVHDGTQTGIVVGVAGRHGHRVYVHFPSIAGGQLQGVREGWHGKFTVDDNDWVMDPGDLRAADLHDVKVPLVRSHRVHAATEQDNTANPEGARAAASVE